MEKFGIDISKWQKGIDISRVKKEGVEFAILRASFTGYGDGVTKRKDEAFEKFYFECKAYEIPVGAYHYSCATTYEQGRAEAEFMYNNCLVGHQFEYPIYIDVEDTHHQAKAGKKAVTEAIKGFCEYLEAKGYYVGVYANSNWFRNYINTDEISKYDFWLANWCAVNPSSPAHGLWQFGGGTNRVRSTIVAGMVCDQNYAYKDYPAMIKAAGLNGYGAATKTVGEIAKEVWAGKWGNGEDRKNKLEAAGYNYEEVQAAVNESTEYYTVERGDNLTKIAARYNTTVARIVEMNGIKNANLIYTGQKLKIR